jgi:hypothetical protein
MAFVLPDTPAVPAGVGTPTAAVFLRMVWVSVGERVSDVEVAGAIDRHAGGPVEARRGTGSI